LAADFTDNIQFVILGQL